MSNQMLFLTFHIPLIFGKIAAFKVGLSNIWQT